MSRSPTDISVPHKALVWVSLLGGLIFLGFPLYWMVRGALIPESIWQTIPIRWIPGSDDLTLAAFSALFTEHQMGKILLNTGMLATWTMVCNVIFDGMAGFALAKLRLPGKKALLIALLITLMIPFEVLMVPLYMVATKMGLHNSMLGMILPGAANAFSIYLMYQFFRGVPDEVLEAARVDGASWWQIYLRIAMPLAAPALATIAVINFLAGWESFIWPLLITDPNSQLDVLEKVIANATLASMGDQPDIDYPMLMAAALLSVVPVMILFLFCQRYFVAGLSGAAVKS